jgi:YfiH family protein
MTGPGWSLEEVGGISLVRCAAFDAIPGVAHAFSTRLAFGRRDFNLGPVENDSVAPRSRCVVFLRAAGLGDAEPAWLRQVHGSVIVNAELLRADAPEADGSIRAIRPGTPCPVPVVRTADCVGVLLVDRQASVVAAVHAGWRGIAAGIGANAVAAFAAFGVAPRDLVVALGPAILGCCYQVGKDVVAALEGACGSSASFLAKVGSVGLAVDLHAALRAQLVAAGVTVDAIHAAPWCTRCRSDLFFSFRGEGPATGRLLAALGSRVGP